MEKRYWWIVGGLAVVFVIAIGALQFWKWHHFGYNGLDLGIYSQTLWSLSHGQWFANSIHDPSYLGDHLELWLVPLAGFYRLWASPLTLLWLHTIILALAVFPFAALARNTLGWRAGLIAAGLWLAHPFIYNAAMYEFHGLVFALPLVLGAILAYVKRRYWWWAAALVGLLLVREDMPIVVAGFGLLAALERRSWKWWLPPVVAGLAWFFVAQAIIGQAQPAGQYKYLAFYGWMGSSLSEIATFPFRHPVIFLQHVFQPNNWMTTAGFLVGFGLLPLLRPKYLLPVGVLYFQLLLIGAEAGSVLRLHYVIPYLPFLAWASMMAVRDVLNRSALKWIATDFVRPIIIVVAVIGPLYTLGLFGLAEFPWPARTNVGLTPPAILRDAINIVPAEAAVLTTFNLLPYFSDRPSVYSLNYVHLGRRQYSELAYALPGPIDAAVIDWQQYYHFTYLYRETLFQTQTGPERLVELLKQQGLRLAYWKDSLAIYTSDGTLEQQLTELVDRGLGQEEQIGPSPVGAPTVQDLGTIELAGTRWQEYQIEQTWLQHKPPDQPLALRISLQRAGLITWTSTRILGQGQTPSNEWKTGEQWRTRYRIAVPASATVGAELVLEVLQIEGRLRLDRIRQFTPVISEINVLQHVTASLTE